MITKSPLVSVIIPCYNYGKFVMDAVKSALDQTYRNIEIIIVNDGSTDEYTNELLANYSHPMVTVIVTSNQGLPMARNNGLKVAKGEFFVPLDADDKLDVTFVEKTLSLASQDPKIGVVYTDQSHFGKMRKLVKMQKFDIRTQLIANMVSVCSLIRRVAYNQVKQGNGEGYRDNLRYGFEDWDLWLSMYELGWKFMHVSEPLLHYRRHQSIMQAISNPREKELMYQLVKNHADLYKDNFNQVIGDLLSRKLENDRYVDSMQLKTKDLAWLCRRVLRVLLRLSLPS